ncbi:MAG: geranylgeranylglyceryl/heptaprenylglyceryl phosphate synthase [Ignavibacteriales bacterium]|nr:geranylgeranylglyceryl/heptaprenylglyceryl phosphate synthase [Ignavibacteriales bacterium]
MTTYERLLKIRKERGAGYFILLDPDKIDRAMLPSFIKNSTEAGVDGFLVGGSLMLSNDFEDHLKTIKQNTSAPVIIFPGSIMQVSSIADAILFLVLISGRNPDYLIGNQVLAAPIVRKSGLEALSTGYMLIEAGNTTSAEFMSNTKPIPRDKSDIALAHALAAEIMGMKLLYLDAGSGARDSVSEDMLGTIARRCALPIIVGGGIRTPEEARKKVEAGASFVVTGTVTELNNHRSFIKEFAEAVHVGSGLQRTS